MSIKQAIVIIITAIIYILFASNLAYTSEWRIANINNPEHDINIFFLRPADLDEYCSDAGNFDYCQYTNDRPLYQQIDRTFSIHIYNNISSVFPITRRSVNWSIVEQWDNIHGLTINQYNDTINGLNIEYYNDISELNINQRYAISTNFVIKEGLRSTLVDLNFDDLYITTPRIVKNKNYNILQSRFKLYTELGNNIRYSLYEANFLIYKDANNRSKLVTFYCKYSDDLSRADEINQAFDSEYVSLCQKFYSSLILKPQSKQQSAASPVLPFEYKVTDEKQVGKEWYYWYHAEDSSNQYNTHIMGTHFADYYGHKSVRQSDLYAIDINYPDNEEEQKRHVYAVDYGTVVFIQPKFGYIEIKHNTRLITNVRYGPNLDKNLDDNFIDGGAPVWYSGYMHVANIPVKVGDTVVPGTDLGTISNVGGTFPAHLHFAVYDKDGYSFSPYFLPDSPSNLLKFNQIVYGGYNWEGKYKVGHNYIQADQDKFTNPSTATSVGGVKYVDYRNGQ